MKNNLLLNDEERWDKLEALNNKFEMNKKTLDLYENDTPEYKAIHKITDKVVEEIEKLVGLKKPELN